MATTVGAAARGSATSTAAASAPARRLQSARWRDPRLAVGVVLVAASVVLGARVIAAADDTVGVWSVRSDMSAGTVLTSADVAPTRIHFTSADAASPYLLADEPLPGDVVLAHDVRAGELLADSALVPQTAAAAELPLAVPDGSLPADLAPGDLVDVWVTPDEASAAGGGKAQRVLSAVTVVSLDTADTALGGGDATRVLIALDESAAAGLDDTLATLAGGLPVLVRLGG